MYEIVVWAGPAPVVMEYVEGLERAMKRVHYYLAQGFRASFRPRAQ